MRPLIYALSRGYCGVGDLVLPGALRLRCQRADVPTLRYVPHKMTRLMHCIRAGEGQLGDVSMLLMRGR